MIESALQRSLVQHGGSRNHRVRVLRKTLGKETKVRQQSSNWGNDSHHGLLRNVDINPAGMVRRHRPQVLSANSNWLGLPRFDKFQETSSQMIAQRGGCEFQKSNSGHESRQVISSTIPYSLSRISSLFGDMRNSLP